MAAVKETFKSFSQKKRPQLQRQFPFLREYQISNKVKKLWEQYQSGTRTNKPKQLPSSVCKLTRGKHITVIKRATVDVVENMTFTI